MQAIYLESQNIPLEDCFDCPYCSWLYEVVEWNTTKPRVLIRWDKEGLSDLRIQMKKNRERKQKTSGRNLTKVGQTW